MTSIRAARPDDLPALRTLLAEAGLVLEGLERLQGDLLVADDTGQAVGAVGIERHGSHALLRSLIVAPGRRGTGLGDALTTAALAHARSAGLGTVWLLTETAEPFFAARGFARVGRETAPAEIAASHEFSSACPASAAFMRHDVA